MADVKPLKVTLSGEISRFEETDVIPATHGGTGASSLSQLLTNILPDQTSHAGDILTAVGDGSVEWTAVTSTQGFTGSQGDIGFTGSASTIAGPAGFTGSVGADGATGFTGSAGTNGATGYTGSAGAAGATGFTGSQGIQGVIGYTGSSGFTGSAGATGFTGSTSYAAISDIAPSPTIGKLWFDSTTGKLKIWYDDGSSSQWVDATPSVMGYTGSQGIAGSQGVAGYTGSAGATGTQVRYLSQPGELVPITGRARWYPPQGLTLTWIEASVNTPSVGADIQLALKMNGITVSGAIVTINTGSNRSSRYNISQAVTTNDYISLDVTQIGTVTPGSDLSVTVAFTYN